MSRITFPRILFLSALFLVAGSMFFGGISVARASSLPITGYAWSSNMGYIHFNGSTYGVNEDSTTGVLSGYAWSPYIGWINFNGAQVNLATGALSGWAYAGSGNWGTIHLAGSNYGVTSTSGCWSGYAYGSPTIGWIHFGDGSLFGAYKVGDSTCGVTPTCTNGAINSSYPACNQCPDGDAYNTSSSSCIACSGTPAGCTGGGGTPSNPIGPPGNPLICKDGASNPPVCDSYPPTATLSATSPINQGQSSTLTWNSTTATRWTGSGFTASGTSGSVSTGILNTPGTENYQIICSKSGVNSTPASASVTVLAPNVTISANPTRVSTGGRSAITWLGTDVLSCTVTGPSGTIASGNADSSYSFSTGSPQTLLISGQSVYTITCTTPTSPITDSVTVNASPSFQEF